MRVFVHSAICGLAVILLAGCSTVTPAQREAGDRMARMMAARFDTPADKPFFLRGGPNAALFVHGFPGTPAQLRPFAEALHAQGWTVRGVQMPGNGSDTARMSSLTGQEWIDTVRNAVAEMSSHYKRVLVVGYSMGAAMSCASLAPENVDGLVLIAPYQWRENVAETFVWTFFRPLMPKLYQPFKSSDFSKPATRALLSEYFPQEFLDQPAYREEIRSYTVSIPLIAQLRSTVRSAYGRKWKDARIPIMILQGTEDKTALPSRSRALAARWGVRSQYIELPGDHLFIKPGSPAFPGIVHDLCLFAAKLAAKPPTHKQCGIGGAVHAR